MTPNDFTYGSLDPVKIHVEYVDNATILTFSGIHKGELRLSGHLEIEDVSSISSMMYAVFQDGMESGKKTLRAIFRKELGL